jgi:electron transfer flavoprotein-quinone oxidoreductase
VVAADGVNSFISRDLGLRGPEPPEHLAVGVKSVIALDRERIEDRFGVEGDGGVAYAVVGDCTAGVAGGGFLYTNRESVSIGVVVRLDSLARSEHTSADLHDRFVSHPLIAGLLRGGELIEYGAHLVAEGGQVMVHDLVRPGFVVVGEAAGLALNTGFTVRGMDLAAGSALAAADAIHAALEADDVSAAALGAYESALAASFVGRDMRTYAKANRFFDSPRVYQDYGPLVADVLSGVYRLDGTPRRHIVPTVRAALKASPLRLRDLAKDGVAALRGL